MSDTDERDIIKRMRAVLKGSATKTTGKMQTILRKWERRRRKDQVDSVKNNVVDKLEKIKEIDDKIQNSLIEEGDAYEKEANEILDYHEQFYELVIWTAYYNWQ